jgi:hypothetical protein
MAMPRPVPQTSTARSCSPRATASATGGDVGVVLAVAVAEVLDLVAVVAEVGGQALLEGGAGVVGADGDGRHGLVSYSKRSGTKVWSVMGGRT